MAAGQIRTRSLLTTEDMVTQAVKVTKQEDKDELFANHRGQQFTQALIDTLSTTLKRFHWGGCQ